MSCRLGAEAVCEGCYKGRAKRRKRRKTAIFSAARWACGEIRHPRIGNFHRELAKLAINAAGGAVPFWDSGFRGIEQAGERVIVHPAYSILGTRQRSLNMRALNSIELNAVSGGRGGGGAGGDRGQGTSSSASNNNNNGPQAKNAGGGPGNSGPGDKNSAGLGGGGVGPR
jgi:hypothetical protein